MLRRILLILTFALIVLSSLSQAQQREVEPRKLVDSPTAGILPRGSFDLDFRILPKGGILAGVCVGLMDRLSVGFSFGGEQIIGSEKIKWNPRPEIAVKYRLFEESKALPAVAIGFDSQGFGSYDEKWDRYAVKSKGFYVALSKNYSSPLRGFGVHVGVNLSREDKDRDSDPSGYVGFDKELNPQLSITGEYDFAINDNEDNSLRSGKGYLNAGVRWTSAERLSLELDFRNLLKNIKETTNGRRKPNPSREIRIIYLEYF